jgi:hypothetical protein
MATSGRFTGGTSRFTRTATDTAGNPVSRANPNSVNAQVTRLAQQLANDIITERELAASRARNGKIYTIFDQADDVLANQLEVVTRGLFSGNTGSLTTMFTSSTATVAQKSYFYEVYDKNPSTDSTATVQFSIAYGNYNGSGSVDTTGNLNNDTPARAIYRQYAQILLPPNDKKFTFNGVDSDSIYVLNFNRARFREKIDPGNFELTLAELTSTTVPAVSSSNRIVQIIDDSSINSPTEGEAGKIYNLLSGSIDGGTSIYNAASPTYFGLLYPQHGIAILDGTQLNKTAANGGVSFNTQVSSSVEGNNINRLFLSLSASNQIAGTGRTGGVQARSAEQVKSTYYFVRVKNAEYNYSNNPTFVTGSLGQVAYSSFVTDPQTYITTVGLYNDRRELLAVAKLSQPLLKAFTREALIKVKLDF